MSLRSQYTCSKIDYYLDKIENIIDNSLDELVYDLCPLFDGNTRDKFLDKYHEKIMIKVKSYIEDVRETNINMREDADNQIDDLELTISDLEEEIYKLKHEL